MGEKLTNVLCVFRKVLWHINSFSGVKKNQATDEKCCFFAIDTNQ